jgi:Flp pilus assembly protein TadD
MKNEQKELHKKNPNTSAQSQSLEKLLKSAETHMQQQRHQAALLNFTQAMFLAPKEVSVLIGCAKALMALMRPTEAALYSEQAVLIAANTMTLNIHVQTLYQSGRYELALKYIEHLVKEDPNSPIVLGQYALCLTQMNRYQDALNIYKKALLIAPESSLLQTNHSFCLLAMSCFKEGFKAFEHRWKSHMKDRNRPWVTPPSATHEILNNKTILIHTEQGLGDSLQFFRYIPMLIERGANVFVEIQPALIPLLSNSYKNIQFLGSGSHLPICDYHFPIMSLAMLFQTEVHTIPAPIPYIFSDSKLVESCLRKVRGSHKKRVGIAWKGSALNMLNHQRSINLKMLLQIHDPNFDFICLQQDINHQEKNILEH